MAAGSAPLESIGIAQGARLLVVLCHPDDELAIAGSLRRALMAGVPVCAVWTHSTSTREAESRRAMAALGPGQILLHFLNGRDKSVLDDIPQLAPEFGRIVEECQPTCCWCPAFEQGHIDHDATHLLAASHALCPTWEYPLYYTYLTKMPILNRFADPDGEIVLELSQDERQLKCELADMYPSQRIRLNLRAYRLWRTLALHPVDLSASERFKPLRGLDYSEPAYSSPLADRIRRSPEWRRWSAKIAEFRDAGLFGLRTE